MASRAYTEFLSSAELSTWRACMHEAVAQADPELPDSAVAPGLAEALCITMYVNWLGHSSGDKETTEDALELNEALQGQLTRRSHPHRPPALALSWALVLAWRGYSRRATEALERGGDIAAEHLLLVLRDDVRALSALKKVITGPAPTRFLPVAWQYASALATIGAVHEAREFLAHCGFDQSDPLIIDVLGATSERLGQWSEAYGYYRGSAWPAHRYRAALIGAIAADIPDRAPLTIDQSTRQLIGNFGGEMSQSDIAANNAFLNACLWNPVHDWLVELELGKLSFRRRQYAEADAHLERALSIAPDDARFAISSVRFFDLTWLTGHAAYSVLNMHPEAAAQGRAAIEASRDDDDTKEIRIWLADATGDLSVIPASLDDWPAHHRADALEAVGDEDRAIDTRLEALTTGYAHRTIVNLIRSLGAARFTRTLSRLSRLVLSESHEDFLALWETARALRPFVTGHEDAEAGDGLEEIDDAFRQRVVELSRFEFKNAVRAYEPLAAAAHPDLAEELLLQVTRQAEGVSELLAVAVLRGEVYGGSDPDGLRCLSRALGEARDRLERLVVTRQLFRYGQIREARRVLADEGVLAAGRPLSHIEADVVLQCFPWLTRQEQRGLVDNALERLNADARAGLLGPDGWLYAQRLTSTLSQVAPTGELVRRAQRKLKLAEGPKAVRGWAGRDEDDWSALRDRLSAAVQEEAPTGNPVLAVLEGSGVDRSLGRRTVVCAQLRATLDDLMATARGVRPAALPEELPIYQGDDRGDGVRAVELCDLWRARLTSDGEDAAQAAAARLQAFFDGEAALLERWEEKRRAESAPTLGRALWVAEALRYCLDLPLVRPIALAHPVLADILDEIEADLNALSADARRMVEQIERELAGATAAELAVDQA